MLRNGIASFVLMVLLAPISTASASRVDLALQRAEARQSRQLLLARKQMALFVRTRDPLYKVYAQDRVLQAKRTEVKVLVLQAQRAREAGQLTEASTLVRRAGAVRRAASTLEGRSTVTEMDIFRLSEARAAGRPLSVGEVRAARALQRLREALVRPRARTAKGPELPSGTTELDMIEAFDRARK